MRFLKAPCSVLVDSLGAWSPFCRWPTDLSTCCCLESGVQTPCPWRSHHTLHCVLSNLTRTDADADATHKRPESGQASLPSLWGGGGFQQGAEVHGGEPGAPSMDACTHFLGDEETPEYTQTPFCQGQTVRPGCPSLWLSEREQAVLLVKAPMTLAAT